MPVHDDDSLAVTGGKPGIDLVLKVIDQSRPAPMEGGTIAGHPTQRAPDNPRAFLDRMIEVLRQSKTLQLPGNVTLQLEAISPLADREYGPQMIAIRRGLRVPVLTRRLSKRPILKRRKDKWRSATL